MLLLANFYPKPLIRGWKNNPTNIRKFDRKLEEMIDSTNYSE
jgi:hypothetical protein